MRNDRDDQVPKLVFIVHQRRHGGSFMNLVSFSIRTKGLHNFARRLWTVFTRFGVSEKQTRRRLFSIMKALQSYQSAPTFFILAVVMRRHAGLLAVLIGWVEGVGLHGYV